MYKIPIKPLSVNNAWKGRRFKTNEYKQFEEELYYLLPNLEIKSDCIEIIFIFGLSSKNSDLDNCLKQTIDVMSKKFNFNDKIVYRIIAEKKDVKKGEEFIIFEITNLKEYQKQYD